MKYQSKETKIFGFSFECSYMRAEYHLCLSYSHEWALREGNKYHGIRCLKQ